VVYGLGRQPSEDCFDCLNSKRIQQVFAVARMAFAVLYCLGIYNGKHSETKQKQLELVVCFHLLGKFSIRLRLSGTIPSKVRRSAVVPFALRFDTLELLQNAFYHCHIRSDRASMGGIGTHPLLKSSFTHRMEWTPSVVKLIVGPVVNLFLEMMARNRKNEDVRWR
jgi:hypothetical protein